jgi:hypothetical protein
MLSLLPDHHYIEQIRKRLWCGHEIGSAAVMVGSGFSLNADKVSESSSSFLLWGELIEKMKQDLYPYQEKNFQYNGSDALKIANEYELVFGRHMLDDLIIKSLPDQNYVPGELHKLLLSLPWSDVFTTNYDTLLERTCPFIHDKKYDLVLTPADLPGRMKPRIIKLHGSFPSQRPFIITEEDYRTYPKRFAAFVNTVQQSIMENILCLIGFSGDDPNFLNWIGWVRDNLGNDTPPIYFCGFVSPAQKRTLEARGIIPIDFTPLFPEEDYPGNLKYKKALEWFLLTLREGKGTDASQWPIISLVKEENCRNDLPHIPPGPKPFTELGELWPKIQHDPYSRLDKKHLLEVLELWKKIRLEYPGWIIAPKESRSRLFTYTEHWIDPILNSIDSLSTVEQFYLLYEINWRLDITLTPLTLFPNLIQKIIEVLEQINPFPKRIKTTKEQLSPDKPQQKHNDKLNWLTIRDYWIDLSFSLIRTARENMDSALFQQWMTKLEEVVENRLDWNARWYYEKCLFYLFGCDQKQLEATLNEWPKTEEIPYWEMKRASLLAELGKLNEAEKIAEAALSKVRSRLKPGQTDYTLLSQEGWGMVLLRAIKINQKGVDTGEYFERWASLSSYRCNPLKELEILESLLKSSRPINSPQKVIEKGFDPGSITEHYKVESTKEEVFLAYSFLRLFEIGAIPIRCGNVQLFGDALVNSAKWIKPYSPLWALSCTIRAGKGDTIQKWFDRNRVVTLSDKEINDFFQMFVPAIEQSMISLQNLQDNGYNQRILPLYIEIISRVCFRFSADQMNYLFDLALELYLHLNSHLIHNSLSVLFKRLLYAIPPEQLLDKIPVLLTLPIREDSFDPFQFLEWPDGFTLPNTYDRSSWSKPISDLLKLANKGTSKTRSLAILRVVSLEKIKALTNEEKNLFSEVLWSRTNPITGLPSDTYLYNSSFLILPEVNEGTAKDKFRKLMVEKKIPNVFNKTEINDKPTFSYSGGVAFKNHINELLSGTIPLFHLNEIEIDSFINWEPTEAEKILDHIIDWWNTQKEPIINYSGIVFFNDPNDHVQQLMPVLSRVVIPYLNKENSQVKEKIKQILLEMEQSGFTTLSVLPATQLLGIYSENEIKNKLRFNLISMNEKAVNASLFGVIYWLFYGVKGLIPPIPPELLNDLVIKIYTRRQPKLDTALNYMSEIVRRLPDCLDTEHINMLCNALEHLLYETNIFKQANSTNHFTKTPINFEDLSEIRTLAAKLACSLYEMFNKHEKPVQEIILKWKQACKEDTLPEVRRIWYTDHS